MLIFWAFGLALAFMVLRRTLGGAPTIYQPFFGTFAQPLFWEFDGSAYKPRRTPTLVLMALLAAAPFIAFGPWWSGFVGAIFTVVFWNGAPFLPNHRFAGPGWQVANIVRYGPCSLGWLLADWFWPRNWTVGRFIDGYVAAGEAGAGLIFGACLAYAADVAGVYLAAVF